MKERYTFYEDPGHGWLEVPLEELHALGIADQITPYSYMHGENAYLEEDQDLTTFVYAIGEQIWWKMREEQRVTRHYDPVSPVRSYTAYRGGTHT